MDEAVDPLATLKVVGHQWYWSYQWTILDDNSFEEFDSYMVPTEELVRGQLRLLTTDNPVYFPTDSNVRVLVTAEDVLHSWAVPAFGVKIDCVPGRLNQVNLNVYRLGVYYGQCSELCGVNHGFMPIEIIASEPLVY
jgi:cytochrome c oxidase subunit 2